jgi:hypothetical protein
MKPFPTDTIADLSTAHLTSMDVTVLHGPTGLESCIIEYPTGFFVYTGGTDSDSQKTVIRAYQKLGVSAAVTKILKAAARQGCKWVCFDADGPVIKGWKVHKH